MRACMHAPEMDGVKTPSDRMAHAKDDCNAQHALHGDILDEALPPVCLQHSL